MHSTDFQSSIIEEPVFYYRGVDWWLVGTIITFIALAILILIGIWLEKIWRKKSQNIDDEDDEKKKKCFSQNIGPIMDGAMTRMFQK